MKMKDKRIKAGLIGFIGIFFLTALDQWTKYLAVTFLSGKPSIPLIPDVFELHYLENRGAAFGIFQDKQIFFLILTTIYLIGAVWIYFRIPAEKKYTLLHMVLVILTAGALGNFIDRILHHYVIDFFYFSLIDFPIFNVADIYVTVAVILLIISILFVYKEEDLTFLNKKKKEQ